MTIRLTTLVALLACFLAVSDAWVMPSTTRRASSSRLTTSALHQSTKEKVEETTEKWGLEAGLFESLKSNDGASAKSLLKKYGIAYLATSIPLALVSFGLCYLLVDNGVDVAGWLKSTFGIENEATSQAGTFALAYAAHKAASPIRFPPTVLLTPVVANLIGKEANEDVEDDDEE